MMHRLSHLALICATLGCLSACGSGSEPQVASGTIESALTSEDCMAFNIGGKDRICHATGSATNPFVIVDVSTHGCISGHAKHPGDFIAGTDLSCHGQGCLATGAPCDPTIPCCPGLICENNICHTPCTP
jgi:hypothetical protein